MPEFAPFSPQSKLTAPNVYSFIICYYCLGMIHVEKGFTIRDDRKKWILSRADDRWRAFKTRLRRLWLYKKSGRLRRRPPWKYHWITQPIWDKFKEICTTEKFKEMSEDGRKRSNLKDSSYRGGCLGYQHYEEEIVREELEKGNQVDQVPRHVLWFRAHSRIIDGKVTFYSEADRETAEKINALKAQYERGELVLDGGRDDILARALNKPEHGGRVRAAVSGITISEYFGVSRPTPPSQLRAELSAVKSELALMKNNQQLMMTFMTSSLNQEQMKQFMVCSNDQFGSLSRQPIDNLIDHNDDQFDAGREQDKGFFTQLLTKGDDCLSQWSNSLLNPSNNIWKSQLPDQQQKQQPEAYNVPWFDQQQKQQPEAYNVPWFDLDVETTQQPQSHFEQQPNSLPMSSPKSNIYSDTPIISVLKFPKGIYDCCLAIDNDGEVQIVANGQVHVSGETEVTLNHFNNVSKDHRRVSITEEIVPTAPLPCPNEECSIVCQAMCAFVSWPAHLIFPKKKYDKEITKDVVPQSPSSQTSTSKAYTITKKDLLKVNSGLLKALKKEAMLLKNSRRNHTISIPENVFYHKMEVLLDYEELLDLCFQKEMGSPHMSIFMKYLSESCHKDGVSGMYGFVDSNYISPLTPTKEQERTDYLRSVFGCNGGKNINQLFFAPFHENWHWMLAAISPWNGTVFWLDPAGSDTISEFAQRIINEGIIKFTTLHRKEIKKLKKNPVRWKKIQCPCQALGTKDCGYYVCRYMIETIASRRPCIPDEYFPGNLGTYAQENIDEVRSIWATYLFDQIEDEDIKDDENKDCDDT